MNFTKLSIACLFVASCLTVLPGCGSEPATTVIEQDAAAIQQMEDYEAALNESDADRG